MVTSFRRGFDEFRHRKGRIRSAPRATVFVAITVSALLVPWCMRPIMACLVGACKERDPTLEIQKDSVRDQVRRTLTERILAGHYQPGDRLASGRSRAANCFIASSIKTTYPRPWRWRPTATLWRGKTTTTYVSLMCVRARTSVRPEKRGSLSLWFSHSMGLAWSLKPASWRGRPEK